MKWRGEKSTILWSWKLNWLRTWTWVPKHAHSTLLLPMDLLIQGLLWPSWPFDQLCVMNWQQKIGHFGNGGLLCSWGPVRQAGRKLQVMYFSSRAIPVTQEQGNDLWPRSTHEIQMVLPPPSVSVLNSVVTSLSSLGSFQLECFLGPAHTSRPLLTTIPASVAGPWAHIPKPLHLEFQLPSSEQACGKNCANSTRLNSSVCSMALACRVFSECLQTPEIYCNYLTCENKPAYEKSSFSFRGSLRVRALLSKGEFVLRFWL